MKYWTARDAARIIRLTIVVGVAILLPVACAPVAPQFPVMTGTSNIGKFEYGEVVLTCRATCGATWNASRPELLRRYIAGNWLGLADLVIETDFQNDLAYYYLGRAAEGLGKNTAALAYYRVADALATGPDLSLKCHDDVASCDSFSFPNELYDRIRVVKVAINHGRPVVAHRSRPRTQRDLSVAAEENSDHTAELPVAQPNASPSPTDGAWIDPPPTTH